MKTSLTPFQSLCLYSGCDLIPKPRAVGGILILEARDLNHAVQLMSRHPGVKAGPFEIRPAEDIAAMIAESERRPSQT